MTIKPRPVVAGETMTKAKEFRDRETQALGAELAEKHKHLFDLRSQAVTEKLEDPSQLKKTRKEIARIKTILRQRELEAAKK
jgi:large subunit ribosomal protein L29